MNRRRSTLFTLLMLFSLNADPGQAAERPNFLWIVSEDNSKHYLKLFDPNGAATPHVEQLAAQGLIFDRAFSCAPVCSVARTTLITGIYAPRLGTQFHRKSVPVTLPKGWQLFPAYLKEAGYYTTNNAKEDYNVHKGNNVWDESSRAATWKNRPSDKTNFFHVQSFADSHESSLHFSAREMETSKLATNPDLIRIAPYHPDTPLFRYTYARYHDRIRQIDNHVGRMVAELEAAGVLEDTFIFYFGDHGGVLPRSKGYLYESGLHVPLVVRVPKNWKHLVEMPPASRVSGFVSFVDFGPTLLHLAGLKVPEYLDGKPFLGQGVTLKELNQRDEAFGYADRFDEKCDLSRSLRKGSYKYVRHYQAFYPDALQNNYRYNMLAYQEWRALHNKGKLNPIQQQFFNPKEAECLYDLESDPYETKNLAKDPRYQKILVDLRQRLAKRLKDWPDLSFVPENVLVEEAVSSPLAYGTAHAGQIQTLIETADLCLLDWPKAMPKLKTALKSNDPWQRYWAVIACSVFGKTASPLVEDIRLLAKDSELLVRVRAAEFLGITQAGDPRPILDEVLQQSKSPVLTLLTLNTIVFLRDSYGYEFTITPMMVRAKDDLVKRRLDYLLGKL